MAKKYKIKKSNLKEFFGLFSKKPTPDIIQKLIDDDPELMNEDNRILRQYFETKSGGISWDKIS